MELPFVRYYSPLVGCMWTVAICRMLPMVGWSCHSSGIIRHWLDVCALLPMVGCSSLGIIRMLAATIAFGLMYRGILFAFVIPTCLHILNVLGLHGRSCRLVLQRGFGIAWSKVSHSLAIVFRFQQLIAHCPQP